MCDVSVAVMMQGRVFTVPVSQLSIISQRAELMTVGLGPDVALDRGVHARLLCNNTLEMPKTAGPTSDIASWILELNRSRYEADLSAVNGVGVASTLQMFHVWRHLCRDKHPRLELKFTPRFTPERAEGQSSTTVASAPTNSADAVSSFASRLQELLPMTLIQESNWLRPAVLKLFDECKSPGRSIKEFQPKLFTLLESCRHPWYPELTSLEEPAIDFKSLDIDDVVYYRQWLYGRTMLRTVIKNYAERPSQLSLKGIVRALQMFPTHGQLRTLLRNRYGEAQRSGQNVEIEDAVKIPGSLSGPIFLNLHRPTPKSPWGLEIDKTGCINRFVESCNVVNPKAKTAIEAVRERNVLFQIMEVNNKAVSSVTEILHALQNTRLLDVSLKVAPVHKQ